MLYQVCKHCRNFFQIGYSVGEFEIEDGTISLPLLDGQYFMIEGSTLNDGIYCYPESGLIDETFHGTIYRLAIPKEFLDLVHDIEKYCESESKNGVGLYQSESFGGYTYTRATNASGNAASWTNAFASRLNVWRKI